MSATLRVEVVGAESLDFLAELSLLKRALQDDPKNFDALLRRVKFFWALEKYDEMILDAARMIELRPEEHHGLVWRAFPLMMLKRYDEAIQDYQEALAIQPDNAWPMRHLAWMYLTGGEETRDLERAREFAEQALKRKRSPLFLATLGAVCYRQGEFEAARRHLERAASSTVNDDSQSLRLFYLAMTQHRLQQNAAAQESYNKALRLGKRRVSLKYLRSDEIESLRAEAEQLLMRGE